MKRFIEEADSTLKCNDVMTRVVDQGETVLAGLHEPFPRIERSTTSSMQYDKTLAQFRRRPEPPGQMLGWVCRGDPSYLDLANDRMELVPH